MSELPPQWHRARLIDCCVDKPQYGANSPAVPYSPNLPRYVRITDITDTGELSSEGVVSVELNGNEQYLLKDDDFLFARTGATVGKTYLYKSDVGWAIFAGYLIKFRINQDVLHPEFLKYFTQSHRYRHWVQSTLRAGAQPNINAKEYSSLEVPLPSPGEQKNIVHILGTWDEAIATVEQLIAALERRKKGLMQRLLTGHNRFPRFVQSEQTQTTKYGELPAEWDYVPVAKIAQESKQRNDERQELTVLSCTKHDGLVDSLTYFDRQVFSDDTSNYKVVKRGQFAYATNHIEEGSIGYQDLYAAGLVSPMYTVFQTNDRINDSFLFRVLKTERYRHIFESRTNGSVNRRGSLRWKEFSKIDVPLPSLAEQEAIAEVLDTADQEIEIAHRHRDALQRQKKGLMQRLLTGRVLVRPDEEA